MMSRRDGAGIRLLTRNGNDWTERFPLIVAVVYALKVRSCLVDGEAVCCDGDGLASFQRLRRRRDDHAVFLYVFDLLELDGDDLRRAPVEERKRALERLLHRAKPGLKLNEHIDEPGEIVFRPACKMGLEGIVSKRIGSRYRSGRSPDWNQVQEPGLAGREARGGGGLGKGEMAMIPDKPWRLEDMKFHDEGGKRRGELGPVVVVESGGKYSVTMASHDLRLSWSDLQEEQVDPALDAAFVALKARSG